MTTTRTGMVIALVGLVLVGAGYAWAALDSAPDANIGAGLVVLAGGGVVVLGLVVLLVGRFTGRG